jgi:hypothetical protein
LEIKTLYDALIKPGKLEDKSTNFFLLLLNHYGVPLVNKFVNEVLKINLEVYTFRVISQYVLKDSRPDAFIRVNDQINRPIVIFIETKIKRGTLNYLQLQNHFLGAQHEFDNDFHLVFLSNDYISPNLISKLKSETGNENIHFLQWFEVAQFIKSYSEKVKDSEEWLLEQFLNFTKKINLIGGLPMQKEDFIRFVEHY